MSNLSIFNFHQTQVRIQLLNNEPLFCLTDVIKILNIKNANASRFNMSEAGIHKMYIRSGGQNREVTFINEPNLYRVIFRSNKKEAIDFQNWVFEEVLPTIRKTGSYSLTINAEQQQAIQQAVNERVYRTGEKHQAVYSKFHQQFKIPRYQDLPSSKFDKAIEWLGGVSVRSGLSDEDLYILARLYCITHRMHHFISLISPALDSIASKYAENFHSMSFHYEREINNARLIIERETIHIQPKNIIDDWNRVLPIIRHNQLKIAQEMY
jgi:prophage antirepressor-like protein